MEEMFDLQIVASGGAHEEQQSHPGTWSRETKGALTGAQIIFQNQA